MCVLMSRTSIALSGSHRAWTLAGAFPRHRRERYGEGERTGLRANDVALLRRGGERGPRTREEAARRDRRFDGTNSRRAPPRSRAACRRDSLDIAAPYIRRARAKVPLPRGVVVVRGRLHRHPEVPFRVVRNSRTHFRLTKGWHFGYGAPNAFDWLKLSSLRSGKMPRW